MYAATQQFQARLMRIASSAATPTQTLGNTELADAARQEFYEPEQYERRKQLIVLRSEVQATRLTCTHWPQRKELLKVERAIERIQSAQKLLKPEPDKTFSQCFMDVAETTLNHDVFSRMMEMTKQKYSGALIAKAAKARSNEHA